MTNSNLQPATKWLAEKAGYYVRDAYERPKLGVYDHPKHDALHFMGYLPGRSGSYTSEQAWTIVSWLAKAGYSVSVHQVGVAIQELRLGEADENDNYHPHRTTVAFGDGEGLKPNTPPEAALAQAVIALYESEGG